MPPQKLVAGINVFVILRTKCKSCTTSLMHVSCIPLLKSTSIRVAHMQITPSECDGLLQQRDEALAALHNMHGSTSYAQQAALVGEGGLEMLRSDIVRLTERLETVVATNAELICEQALLTEHLQVSKPFASLSIYSACTLLASRKQVLHDMTNLKLSSHIPCQPTNQKELVHAAVLYVMTSLSLYESSALLCMHGHGD